MDFLTGITGTQVFNVIMVPVQIIIIFLTFYYFILSMFGLYRKKEVKIHTPEKSFAVVVAAHNEEAVIGPLVENLLQLDYPRKLYDVFVVADNCRQIVHLKYVVNFYFHFIQLRTICKLLFYISMDISKKISKK